MTGGYIPPHLRKSEKGDKPQGIYVPPHLRGCGTGRAVSTNTNRISSHLIRDDGSYPKLHRNQNKASNSITEPASVLFASQHAPVQPKSETSATAGAQASSVGNRLKPIIEDSTSED